jgi:hypothetical protein
MRTINKHNIERKIGSVHVARRNLKAGEARLSQASRLLESIPFGQPIIEGRRNFYKPLHKRIDSACRTINEWERKAEDREALTEKVEAMIGRGVSEVAVTGKGKYASVGVRTSVNNLDYLRKELAELELKAEEAKRKNKENRKLFSGKTIKWMYDNGYKKHVDWIAQRDNMVETRPDAVAYKNFRITTYDTNSAKIKDRRDKIARLERMQSVAEKAEENAALAEMLENGTLNQWQKQPVYYFISGMRKTAVMQTETGFVIPLRYAPSEENRAEVEEIVKRLNE